jgi:UDPglucose 6-dehydrogenase
MNIIIIGTGYVGLVTGACFSEMGVNVTCIDIDNLKIQNLLNGIVPIYEPGLDELIKRNVKAQRLSFTTDLESCINEAEIVFIAVGTPPKEDGSADLKYVLDVAHSIGTLIQKYTVIVTKSTVPIGTAKKVATAISKEINNRTLDIEFDVASNPEFLKEGAAIKDFMTPDRVVIGVENERARVIMEKLYHPFTLNGFPILIMDIPSAEMTKYAANAMLATRISFMNEMANLCELLDANIDNVRKGIATDSRIGSRFLYAGCGYGGSCFPKDVKALAKIGIENGYRLKIIEAVENVNEFQKNVVYEKLFNVFNGKLKGKTIAIWGLAFKPETDDIREAPSLVVIKKLLKSGAKIKVYDPIAMKEVEHIFKDKIVYSNDMYEAIIDVDAIALITEWKNFRLPNWKVIYKAMKNHIIIDGRNIYDKEEMIGNGFTYLRIGEK